MFTDQQNNIIIGLLLGDGHLSLKGRSKNASLIVKRSQHDLEYLEYHAEIFSNYLTKMGLKKFSRFDHRTNKYYHCCEFILKANIELTRLHPKWYVNTKKIVPKDLELNPEIIATWLCDDGWVLKSKNGYLQIGFATDGSSKEEVVFLRDLLSKRYSERIGLNQRKNDKYQIHLSDYAARKLIIDIDPVFPKGMERKKKWLLPFISESFFSIKLSSDNRKCQVEEFLKSNDKFYLADLAKYLDWYYVPKSGVKTLDTQNAKRYLKKYLDDGSLIEVPRTEGLYKKGISFKKKIII